MLWLDRGILGDDTHGHVDDLARFVGLRTVVAVIEKNRDDANFELLRDNLERLRALTDLDGRALEVVTLPMPAPLSLADKRLPASYANFYIANSRVLMPTFNDPNDREALGILADLFPDRTVVGIHAGDLIWGLGTLHCLTQQQPARDDCVHVSRNAFIRVLYPDRREWYDPPPPQEEDIAPRAGTHAFPHAQIHLARYRLARHDIVRQCVVPTHTAGARSGVWTVCPEGLGPDSVVYSFGVGDNIEWERGVIERFGVTVHAFDPTPACVSWLQSQALPDKFRFRPSASPATMAPAAFTRRAAVAVSTTKRPSPKAPPRSAKN